MLNKDHSLQEAMYDAVEKDGWDAEVESDLNRDGFRKVSCKEVDGEFVATSDDFPSLSWCADSRQEAHRGLRRLIREYELSQFPTNTVDYGDEVVDYSSQ